MRKITQKSIEAFMNAKDFRSDNMVITKDLLGNTEMYLYRNLIARRNLKTGVTSITNCGWFTNTTKERFNAIPGVNIYQKAGKWFLNGLEWDGNWIEIK